MLYAAERQFQCFRFWQIQDLGASARLLNTNVTFALINLRLHASTILRILLPRPEINTAILPSEFMIYHKSTKNISAAGSNFLLRLRLRYFFPIFFVGSMMEQT